VKAVYQAALDEEPAARAAFVRHACGDDAELLREVESLLAHDETAEGFLETPAIAIVAAPDPAPPALAGRVLGHYRVERLLGAGGMGEVYLARDPRLDRPVALKILPADLAAHPGRLQRFVQEARSASALNHPNVATIHDVGESDGIRFIVMEYIEGATVADTLAGRPLTHARIVDIAAQVADALEAAHAKGITHRDIKPANLMVTPEGRVKVLDFGIAKSTHREHAEVDDEATRADGETAVGTVVGSLSYMSPEQIAGRPVDARSDIFSLGASVYEMATGRLPFSGATRADTMGRILYGRPEPITRLNADIPHELERVTMKCLEKTRERRYQSARELAQDLHRLRRSTGSDELHIEADAAPRHNLPAALTSFVGRDRAREELHRALAGARLVTVTGAGGCGKTRLALRVAADLLPEYPGGVWVVDLSTLSEPGLVAPTLRATLGIRESASRTLEEALVGCLRARRTMLVFDNCEHLIAEVASLVEQLLRQVDSLRVLATSREALGLPGEIVWRVPSMALPADAPLPALAEIADCEAVRLFADRAMAVDSTFALTAHNAAAVVEICRRLDGIPLAIELAAAKLRVLSADQLHDRLKDRFRLLTGGSRTAVARQRTLEATIDWSYDLLSEPERVLLCRLSVFAGGWTLEAAEEICHGEGLDRPSIVELLSNLVDKSLVNVDAASGGERRYRCLETVRQYGRERLVRLGQSERTRQRHLDVFLALAARAEPELQRANQASWLARLELEHANLRSALEWSLDDQRHGIVALEMASRLAWFWMKRGHLGEGEQWLARALAAAAGAPPDLRARALFGTGLLSFFRGDYSRCSAAFDQCLTHAQRSGDFVIAAMGLGVKAFVAMESGDWAEGVRLAGDSAAAARASGVPWVECLSLQFQAWDAMRTGDLERAIGLTEHALALLEGLGDLWSIGLHTSDLALFHLLQGQLDQAEAVCATGIQLFQQLEDRFGLSCFLAILSGVSAVRGRPRRAARLWGGLHGLLESIASPLQESFKQAVEVPYIAPTRESLGAPGFDAAFAEGRAMSMEQVIRYALAAPAPGR
jgi:non-specific serine/threonine protein kinase